MSVIFVRPGGAMGVGGSRLALYAPPASNNNESASQDLAALIPNTIAWWDASSPSGLLGPGNMPLTAWSSEGVSVVDKTGQGNDLVPFRSPATTASPIAAPHLCGLLGGAGFPTVNPALAQPVLDPSAGWMVSRSTVDAGLSWTWFMVWSRPNWRQGTNLDGNPITLLTMGSRPVLQIDSRGGENRLILFPGTGHFIAATSMARRHTHSFLLRYSPESGADLWLDDVQVAHGVQPSATGISGQVLLLHDGTGFGGGQCWLHEAAQWDRSLSDGEAGLVLAYAHRWARGARKGVYLVFNGQSNAINYTLNDGAGGLLARGIAWFLGALSYNVFATSGSPSSYTMQSGHGLYEVTSSGYPGSFLHDPGDGSDPSGWQLGADGQAVRQAISGLPAEDIADLCAFVWPWNETDSLRQFGELATFKSGAVRLLSLLRDMVGDASRRIPLVWWNAIPYGSPDGITMHREVVEALASDVSQNVIIGNPQTSDSNPRGSTWDPLSGTISGGDLSHRDGADNRRFAMLAAPVVARRLITSGFADSNDTIPAALPMRGGPSIAHVYRASSNKLIVTVAHDAGSDLKIPLKASQGQGFTVMDGGAPGAASSVISAVACVRLDPTHLEITLASEPQHSSGACRLFYPYGPAQIGRGNAVTDNFSEMPMPDGWDIGTDLGAAWKIDCPLAATFSGILLSDLPA